MASGNGRIYGRGLELDSDVQGCGLHVQRQQGCAICMMQAASEEDVIVIE